VRSSSILLACFAAFGACTPEAIEVEPSDGAAGEEPMGSGGDQTTGGSLPSGGDQTTGGSLPSGGKGGSAGNASCAPVSSPRPSCTECIPQQCPTQAQACEGEGSACTCGRYGDYQGQMNCLLACATLSPMMSAANTCANQCGFGSLGNSNPAVLQLFNCLVNPPMGPPLCPDCFPVH
jgi:hypothetical protein